MPAKFTVGDIVKIAYLGPGEAYKAELRYRIQRVKRGGVVDIVCVSGPLYGPEYKGQRVSGLVKADN
jgi:hypothetical protein